MGALLVFGGTTEGRAVASFLDEACIPYFYSTKTPVKFTGKGTHIVGDMDAQEIQSFCTSTKITTIINASHPFATKLDENIRSVTKAIKLIRFQRAQMQRAKAPLVKYVRDFEAMIQLLKSIQPDVTLALTGVQTIEKLKLHWEKHPTYFRILDRSYSKKIAQKNGFPAERILLGTPQKLSEEIALINQLKPAVILTKESGYNGGLHIKIQAATACKTPIFILEKPLALKRYEKVSDCKNLYQILNGRTL